MANFRQLAEDKNALCYVWLTFALLILAVVCFGVSTYQSYALYAGIMFLLLSAITSLLYIGRRWQTKHPNVSFCEAHCGCCQLCCGCLYYSNWCQCVGDCCRAILCLPPLQRTHQIRRERARRRLSNANAFAESHVIVINHFGHELTIPSNRGNSAPRQLRQGIRSSTHSKLRRMENEIQNLFQQYSYLQTDAAIANSLTGDYNELLSHHRVLGQWIENTSTPVDGDIQQMKQTVKKISRTFRLARARFDQDRSVHPDLNTPLSSSATSSSDPSQCVLYTTELAGLPPYQLKDPLKALDTVGDINSTADCYSLEHCGLSMPPGAVNGQLSRLAVHAEMGSLCSLGPPEDETEAPPTYEEAVSTAV